MTMHLVGPYMTTTKYNSKSKKTKNKRLLAAQERHEKWMEEQGYNKVAKSPVNSIPDYKSTKPSVPLSNKVCSNGTAKERKEYTGTLVKGIATMHKSNAVPITTSEQAIEVSAMRR
jgi:hypothetical protein